MMKALITLSVFLFIVTCSPISQINQVESTVFDSFSIISIESNLVEIKYHSYRLYNMLRQPADLLKNTCNAFIEKNKPLNEYEFFSEKIQ